MRKNLAGLASSMARNKREILQALAAERVNLSRSVLSLRSSLGALQKTMKELQARPAPPPPPPPSGRRGGRSRKPSALKRPARPGPSPRPRRPAPARPGKKALNPEIQRRLKRIQALQVQLDQMRKLLDMMERKGRSAPSPARPPRRRGRKL